MVESASISSPSKLTDVDVGARLLGQSAAASASHGCSLARLRRHHDPLHVAGLSGWAGAETHEPEGRQDPTLVIARTAANRADQVPCASPISSR